MSTAWEIAGRMPKKQERPKKVRGIDGIHENAVELLRAVYLHRYLTADQALRLLGFLKTIRTARDYLRTLWGHRLLDRVPVVDPASDRTFYYFVTSKGLSFLKNEFESKGKLFFGLREDSRRAGKTYGTIKHESLITEVQMDLFKTASSLGYHVTYTERRFHHPDRRLKFAVPGRNGKAAEQYLEPDACFCVSSKCGHSPARFDCPNCLASPAPAAFFPFFYLELDRGGMSIDRIFEKLPRYVAWADSVDGQRWLKESYANLGAKNPGTNFRLLIVFFHRLGEDVEHRRLLTLLTRLLEIPACFRSRLWLVEGSKLKDHDDLTREAWLAGADMSWLPDFELLTRGLATLKAPDRHAKQIAFLREHIAEQTRRPLIKRV